jgi:archaellum component FlaC
MSQAASREDIDEVIELLQGFTGQVSDEFVKVSDEFVEVKRGLAELDAKYDKLLNVIDGFISRIDKYELELAARDRQFARLLDWARKVSEKTGIPLENL